MPLMRRASPPQCAGQMAKMSQPDTGPAYVFEDRKSPGDWRIEWINDEGDIEVAIFAGPKARERALRYAERQYGCFEEVRFYH